MRERGIAGEVMRLNINYLLFQLLHLVFVDDSVNQEEILRMISEGTFEAGVLREVKLICVGSTVRWGLFGSNA